MGVIDLLQVELPYLRPKLRVQLIDRLSMAGPASTWLDWLSEVVQLEELLPAKKNTIWE